MAVNCGALARELAQSELFGYKAGAFTGADNKGRIGKFEQADKGTLFLDEISEMPLELQVNLLRPLEERCVVRVGGMPDEALFSVTPVAVDLKPEDLPGTPLRTCTCARCGETVLDGREVVVEGETLCRSCATGRTYYRVRGGDGAWISSFFP